jgi:maltose O-acetyltransferase
MYKEKKGIMKTFISALVKKLLHYTDTVPSRSMELNEFKKKGMKIGKDVIIDPRVIIDKNFYYLISIGDNSIICANVTLLAHDSSISYANDDYGRIGQINIKENCIISVNSIIMPGVTIGPNVLVAAGSLVNKDIPPNSCVAGVPARFYMTYSDLLKNQKEMVKTSKIYHANDLIYGGPLKEDLKKKVIEDTKNGPVFLKYDK